MFTYGGSGKSARHLLPERPEGCYAQKVPGTFSKISGKGFSVASLLSILLPVKNVQATLANSVHEILEIISEWTKEFELLILDDGSTDATSEVAVELTRAYPQVRAVCLGRSQGAEAVVQHGLSLSRGKMVLIHNREGGMPLEEISRRWKNSSQKSQFMSSDASPGLHLPLEPLAAGEASSERVRIEKVHAPLCEKSPNLTRKHNFRLIARHPAEESPACSRPGRPNFMQHVRQSSSEE